MKTHTFPSFRIRLIYAIMAVICVPAIALAASPKAERIAGYKASKRAVASIKDALDSGEFAAATDPAQAMSAFAARLISLYPQEVGDEFVSASMEAILKNYPDFSQKAEAFAGATRELAELTATAAPDPARLRASLGNVQASCLACHRSYLGR